MADAHWSAPSAPPMEESVEREQMAQQPGGTPPPPRENPPEYDGPQQVPPAYTGPPPPVGQGYGPAYQSGSGVYYQTATGSYSTVYPPQGAFDRQPLMQNVVVFGRPPRTYMALNVIACLFCFWPLGLVGIIFSSKASDDIARGDYAAAHRHARMARTMGFLAVGLGAFLIGFILWLFLGSGIIYYDDDYY